MFVSKYDSTIMELKSNLKDKYVAYLDVLGFKELVYNKKIESLETYFTTVRESLKIIGTANQNIESLLISDSSFASKINISRSKFQNEITHFILLEKFC